MRKREKKSRKNLENTCIENLYHYRSRERNDFFRRFVSGNSERAASCQLCLQASWPHAAPQLARPSPREIPRSILI